MTDKDDLCSFPSNQMKISQKWILAVGDVYL